jgi:hypothetical protein
MSRTSEVAHGGDPFRTAASGTDDDFMRIKLPARCSGLPAAGDMVVMLSLAEHPFHG